MSHARELDVGRCDSRYDARHLRRKRRKSDAYRYRPLLEPLEPRRLLTSVTGQDPLPNTHDAPVMTDVSAVFDAEINPATVSAASFAVHGMQTGQILEVFDVSGDTATLSPAADFHPGELVQATLTTGIENLGGELLDGPFVWQFRTEVSGGTGLFGDSGQSLGGSSSNAVALGDVDGDGDLDAFAANGYFPEPSKVWLNDGNGTFTDSGQTLGNSGSHAVALGDLDGDGDLDAFVGNTSSIGAWPNQVWLNDGGGKFTDSGQNLGFAISEAVALGDVDGDGDLDAVVAGRPWIGGGVNNKVWLNDGNGNFSDSHQSLGDSGSHAVALGDLDGDGDLDVVLVDGIWLNDGSATFTGSSQNLSSFFIGGVALGDLDGDGDLDAFVGERSIDGAPNAVWLNQDPLPGDFDNDQGVDGDDFLIWQAGFGIPSGATRYNGDADFDGDVDGDDLLVWQANFGNGAAAGGASTEPTVRSGSSDRLDSTTSRSKAVDETFAEQDRVSARWTKRALREELVDELAVFK